MPLKVAIVGRPNVGKSTLFNRLVGRRLAIVNDQPGVTRDRREAEGRLGDLDLLLIDTAGFEDVDDESLQARMRGQTEAAIRDADVCFFVIDGREGVTSLDRIFADLVRRRNRPVILLANKAEGRAADAGASEAFALGLGEAVLISAEHGEGLADLYAALTPFVAAPAPPLREGRAEMGEADEETDEADEKEEDAEGKPLRIAIVGRPNAGKSTLVNRLIGEERLLTGPEAGITRDAIPVDWEHQGRAVRLVDTAGLRRRARVQETLEKLSTSDTIRAITFAEVVILVMDAQNAFETQDMQIADLVEREGRALVFCLAKWDLIEDPQQRLEALRETAERMLPQVRGTPLIPLSAETGRGVDRLMPAVFATHAHWSTKVKTRDLNDWLAMAVQRHPPPAVNGRRIKPKYMAQLKGRPPTFVLFASRADHLPEQYRRYLINSLRESFDLPGVPIRVTVKSNKNPYADESDGNRKQPRGRFADSVRAPPRPGLLAAQGGAPQGSGDGQASRPNLPGSVPPAKPGPAKAAKATKPRARPMAPAKAGAAQRGGVGIGAKKPQVRAKGGRNANRIPTTHKLRKPRPPRRTSPPKS